MHARQPVSTSWAANAWEWVSVTGKRAVWELVGYEPGSIESWRGQIPRHQNTRRVRSHTANPSHLLHTHHGSESVGDIVNQDSGKTKRPLSPPFLL